MISEQFSFSGFRHENSELMSGITQDVTRLINEDDLLNGTDVSSFEDQVSNACGRAYAIAVASGTDAIFFALIASGVESGDEVLVPGFSFVATASAILRAGAKPIFVDVSLGSVELGIAPCTVDLRDAERKCSSRTKAMIWAGMFGGLGDPDPVSEFASKRKLILIEDAAQSFGASYAGRPAGRLGLSSAFSFDRQKALGGLGTGGAVVTDCRAVAGAVRALRYHGKVEGGYVKLGYNSQMNGITAAVLLRKLPYLETWAERRRQISNRYDGAFADTQLTILEWPSASVHVRHKYVALSARRSDLRKFLSDRGIPTKVHYEKPLHKELMFGLASDEDATLTTCEQLANTAISLPLHAYLSDDDVGQVVEAVQHFNAEQENV